MSMTTTFGAVGANRARSSCSVNCRAPLRIDDADDRAG